jgi:hypothetical protein
MKTNVNVPLKSIKQAKLENNLFFVGILSATDKTSRIRIRTKMSRIPNTACSSPTVLLELTETLGTADGSVLKYRKSFDFLNRVLVPLGSLAVKKMLRYGYFIKYP